MDDYVMRSPPQDLLDIFKRFHAAIGNLVKESRKDGLERGFPICEKEGNLYHPPETVGTENEIPIMKTCYPDKNIVMVHTHPNMRDSYEGGAIGSYADPFVFAMSDLKYLCAIDTDFYYDRKNHIHCMNRTRNEQGMTPQFEWIDGLL